MKLRPLRIWVLLAAVLMGQWLTVAHASQHPALEPVADALCVYCTSGIGSGALPSLPSVQPPSAGAEAPCAPLWVMADAQSKQPPRNRGPPLHS